MALVNTTTPAGNMWMDLVRFTHTANKAKANFSIIKYLVE